MQNYRFLIQYDGSRYHGWQSQGNTDGTIQGRLEQVLSQLDGTPVEVHGSGRTDAGVHAAGQVANARLNTPRSEREILNYVNSYLPQDIAVLSVQPCDPRFHARLNAQWKRYEYAIRTGPVPDVFRRKYQYALQQALDVPAMRRAAAHLLGTHDFKSFCGNRRMKKSTVRSLYQVDITDRDDLVTLSFVGSGFLFRMVRILAGTLVEVGLGRRTPDDLPAILAAQDRAAAGPALPPQGLCLMEVGYAPYVPHS